MRMVRSVSSCSAAACSARVWTQPNRTAATIHPHSASESRPIGVPGGMGPPAWTTPRAPVMATVARRCQSFSSADSDTCPIVRDVPFMTPTPGE
jgi:hypothetical protein